MFRIMVVEDEEAARGELGQLLGNALYEVCFPKGFSRLAKQILEMSPDLVLLDMNLE